MAEKPEYSTELAQEFERLWQKLVIEKTSEAANAAITNALADIVGKMDQIERQTESRFTQLDARIAKLDAIDERIKATLDRGDRDGQSFDSAHTKVGLLSEKIDGANSAFARLGDAEARIANIGKFVNALESETQRAALRSRIAETIALGRSNNTDACTIVQQIEAVIGAPAAVGGATSANEAGWWEKFKSLPLPFKAFFALLIAALAVVTWQTKVFGLFTQKEPPSAAAASQAVDQAVEDGWKRLQTATGGQFESFCGTVSCDSFAAIWNQPEFAAEPQRKLTLLGAITATEPGITGLNAEDCTALISGISSSDQLKSWERSKFAQAGRCLQEQTGNPPSVRQLEIAEWIAKAYLRQVPEQAPVDPEASGPPPSKAASSAAATSATSTAATTGPAPPVATAGPAPPTVNPSASPNKGA